MFTFHIGPAKFFLRDKGYKRKDLQLKNKNGHTLQCSHFEPMNLVSKKLPCVIYLHGNSSSRVEGIPAAEILLSLNITVFCFDFAGCGYSEGEYISLGWYELNDVETVVEYLKSTETVSSIGLWGRSMGSVTALLYAEKDPSLSGLVLDSPFTNLRVLIDELAKKNTKIPKIIVSGAMSLVRKTILTKAKFDINKLVPIEHIEPITVPALFIAGVEDSLIGPHHTRQIYEKFRGKKDLLLVEGDHNSIRPTHVMESIAAFFQTILSSSSSQDQVQKGGSPISLNEKKLRTAHQAQSQSQDDEEDFPKFELKDPKLLIVGANQDEIPGFLARGFGEDELAMALKESMKLFENNNLKTISSSANLKKNMVRFEDQWENSPPTALKTEETEKLNTLSHLRNTKRRIIK